MNIVNRIHSKFFEYWENHDFKIDCLPDCIFMTEDDYLSIIEWCNFATAVTKHEYVRGLKIISKTSEVTSVGRFKSLNP